MKSIFFSTALFYASTFGVGWNGPKPTSVAEDEASLQEGWTPRPTGSPQIPVELLKRDTAGPVCGYESGIAASSVTCSPNFSCLYFTDVGLGACCNGKNYLRDCGIWNTCIDYVSWKGANACSTTCDDITLVCTEATKPYCQSWVYPDVGVEQFGCDSISASRWRTVGTSYLGQSAISFANRFTMDLSASSIATATGITRVTKASASASASATNLVPSNNSNNSDDDDEHHVSIGAIVGGVIGGLFIIGALLAGGIFLCLRNRKKKRNLAAAAVGPTSYNPGPGVQQAPEQQPMMQTQPPPPPQQFSPPPGLPPQQSTAVAGGYYAPPPASPYEDKKPTYTSQTQSYHGSEISAPGSPPPPQYAAPMQNMNSGYMQPPPDRQSGIVSPVNGAMTPQHTGAANPGDNIAQLDGSGIYPPSQQQSAANPGQNIAQLDGSGIYPPSQQQSGGAGVGGRRPVGQGNVYEAP
ncbi:MAG: hypothetical protein M1812_007236 [Candelaria pacifica]|nr:MAG: hypothetical protein M1812_007236 [Candelaria pacifica]